MSAIPYGARLLGQNVQTVVQEQPPLISSHIYQPPKQSLGYTLSHYTEDHGDHIVERSLHQDRYYTPDPELHQELIPQNPLISAVPISRVYSVPVSHIENIQHVDYEQHQHIDNVVTHVPEIVHREETKSRTVQYQEPVTTINRRTIREPITTMEERTEQRPVTTMVDHIIQVPVTKMRERTIEEPITSMITRTREEPYTETHHDTVMREVVTPTIHTTTIPVVRNEQREHIDEHIVEVPY